MTLTREERERRIVTLSQQGYATREIAKDTHTSFRDISAILKRASQQKELGQIRSEKAVTSTRAYQLFSEDKSILDVSIALQIKADEAIEYHNEYCRLIHRDRFNQIYEELHGNVQPIVNLHRLTTAASVSTPEIIELLKIANNDLPIVESKFQTLSRNVMLLELDIQNSLRILEGLDAQITNLRRYIEQNLLFKQELVSEIDNLYQKKMKLQGLVRCFEYNNKTYLEIKKNIEQVEFGTSSDQKKIIRLALACLMASMINNQKKYIFLLSSSSSLANRDIHCEPNLRVESSSKIDYKDIVAAMILLDAEEL